MGGNIVAMIAFIAFEANREWPEAFIARLKVIGEVMAQALVRRRSEAALRATQSELARVTSLTAAGQMAASIAHEINQPLNAIVTNGSAGLRWLSNPTPDRLEEVRTALDRIVREGNRASQVVDRIRAMFKNDFREKASLDINLLIREVLALLDFELRRSEVLVRAELIPGPLMVLADRIQLQQVIANLITNAIEAMSTVNDRARTLRVESAISKPDGVLISVEDSGPGIDRENLGHIFHPFFTTKCQGMGMGLAICRSIVESHGGSLSASPGYPHGAAFRVVLPIEMTHGATKEDDLKSQPGGFGRGPAMSEKALPPRAEREQISPGKKVAPKNCASGPSLDELLAFERLFSDLSARFANVAADQVVA
ncbi:MAG: sensor histidine kinase, partial [Terriglobales bacterium]